MIKILKTTNILIFLTLIFFTTENVYAESKPDCSQYTHKTFAGTLAKRRCLKGLPPKEKTSITQKLKKLNIFKKN